MATGGVPLLPSKEKTNFLRLVALIIDGGTLSLKTQFDAKFPPQTLSQDLQAHGNYLILLQLKNKKHLTQAQFNLLFPPNPLVVTKSSDFDVSLFTCLIQNLPAFQQQNSPIWKRHGPPAPTDISLAADVKRLRILRNYVSHPASAELSDQEFQDKWKEASDVIQRLCVSIPGIQNYLANFLQLSIDPEKEQDYIDRLKQYEEFDTHLEKNEKLLKEAQDDLKKTTQSVLSHETDIKSLRTDVDDVSTDLKTCKKDIEQSVVFTKTLADDLETQKKTTAAIQDEQEKRSKMSSEFKAIVSRSTMFFEEKERNEYIETTTSLKAREKLDENKIVILSGHPGEGKTTMAKQLLVTQFPPSRCINLREPSDWKHLDLSLNLFDAVLIDDIFGSGVLDESLVKKWERKLNDLSTAIKEKGIKVVITSRHYILEETKQLFRSLPLFKKENIQLLSSSNLSEGEKIDILKSHLKAEERDVDEGDILLCVYQHSSVFEQLLFGTNDFLFGFPECVNLFARQDEFFEEGPAFFSRPNSFMKNCIHQLYRDEEKFLALIIIWANDSQTLKKSELDESQLSHRLKRISQKFQFKLKGKLIKRLRKSLDYHVDGLLHFSKETGLYSFSHNVICDMVGLVIAEENPDEVLEFCTRGFILTYVTTQSTNDEFKFHIDKYLFDDLANRFVGLMMEEHSVEGILECGTSLLALHRGGKMKNTVMPKFTIDFSIIKHESFKNEAFVDKFLKNLREKGYLENMFSHEIMEMSGFFLRYGIKIDQQRYFLLSYAVFIGAELFAEKLVTRQLLDETELTDKEKTMEYTMSLLFAVHHQSYKLVKVLTEQNAMLTEEALYIAAHKADMDILTFLLKRGNRKKIDNIQILNGNNALIIAAKKGFFGAVQCFIDCGYDLMARNKDGLSALDKAIAYKHEDVCELLINANVPLNKSTQKFKRTPLHTAVDLGLFAATKTLLVKGAKVKTKDHKGFYPIHSAALNGHYNIVTLLLERDPTQAGILTKTYGKKSVMKGKTVFHIALFKKDFRLLQVLLMTKADPNVRDLYGQTLFLEALLAGQKKFINMLKDVVDLSVPDKNGFTPLHVAVYKGYSVLAQFLCSAPSVNVNAKDRYGKTPLHVAAIKGFSEIFITLVDHKADWRMVTKRGDTVMHLAVRHRDKQSPLQQSLIDFLSGSITGRLNVQNDDDDNDSSDDEDEVQQQDGDLRDNAIININSGQDHHDEHVSRDVIYERRTIRESGVNEDDAITEMNNSDATLMVSDRSETSERENEDEPTRESPEETINQDNSEQSVASADPIVTTHGQNVMNILKRTKSKNSDYNLIISILADIDRDFVQKGLGNKYGERIVVSYHTCET